MSEVNENAHNKMMSNRHFVLFTADKLNKTILHQSQYSMRVSYFMIIFLQPNMIMLSLESLYAAAAVAYFL